MLVRPLLPCRGLSSLLCLARHWGGGTKSEQARLAYRRRKRRREKKNPIEWGPHVSESEALDDDSEPIHQFVHVFGNPVFGMGRGEVFDRKRMGFLACDQTDRFVMVACGGFHCVLCTEKGQTLTFGMNFNGQLGLGMGGPAVLKPATVRSLSGKRVRTVSCGYRFSALVTEEEDMFVWGSNNYGQLGLGTEKMESVPTPVDSLRGKGIQQVACGESHVLARTSDGGILSWGWGAQGRLGLGSLLSFATPQVVPGFNGKRVIHVACGSNHSVAITEDESVYVWGSNMFGQLGLGTAVPYSLVPKRIDSLSDKGITCVACGEDHTLAVSADGVIYGIGLNTQCQATGAKGGPNLVHVPQPLTTFQGRTITSLKCGMLHNIAVIDGVDVYGWGGTSVGQIFDSPLDIVVPEPRLLLECSVGLPIIDAACGQGMTVLLQDANACIKK